MRPVKVCFILRSFAPRLESGSLRCTAFAKHLPDLGDTVSVFCSTEYISRRLTPTVSILNDFWSDDPRWLRVTRAEWAAPKAEQRSLVWRVPLLASRARRQGQLWRAAQLYPKLCDHIQDTKPDILFASCAPIEILILAQKAASEFNLPFVADLRDPYATASAVPHRHYVDYRLEKSFEKKILEDACHVTVASRRSAELLVRDYGISPAKTTFLPNGYNVSDFEHTSLPHVIEPDEFLIVHTGEINDGERTPRRFEKIKKVLGFDYDPMSSDPVSRSPRYLLNAVRDLINRRPDLRRILRVVFTGLDLNRAYKSIDDFPFKDCLRIYGRIANDQVHGLMLRANVLVLLNTNYFRKGREFCTTIPAKTYSYIATGRPILAATASSEIKIILTDQPHVAIFDYDDTGAIADHFEMEIERQARIPLPVATAVSKATLSFSRAAVTVQLSDLLRKLVHNVAKH